MTNDQGKLNLYSPLLPLLIVVIIIGLGYLVIQPLITTLKDLNTKIAARSEQITQMESKISNLKYLKGEFAKATADLDLLNIAIPKDSQMPEILMQLAQIAGKSGVQITSINPKSGEGENLSINTQGDFASISSFIENLEKNLRPITIRAISFTSSKNQEGVSTMTANISLEVFTLPSSSTSSDKIF